jgi:hypothetical protein
MTAVPEDVMAAAREARDEWLRNPSRITFESAIARAILAERRRCAALLKDTHCDIVPYLMSDEAVDAFFGLPSEPST